MLPAGRWLDPAGRWNSWVGQARLCEVGRGCDGAGAAAGEGPGQGAGCWLLEMPAGCLLRSVVPSAQGRQITLAGASALVKRLCVVVVAAAGGAAAAGEGAGPVAGFDQVPQGG
jgi:hypothetical protein